MSPKVSVIIPTFNVEKYIKKCVDSVLKQTLKEIEVICVDDGSTDSTLKILREYEKKDKRVKVIFQKNINAGAARNNGLEHASGKYVTFLDADDFFEKEMLAKMFERAEETKAEIIVVDSDVFDDEKGTYADGWPFVKKMIPRTKVFAGEKVDKLFLAFVGWPWDKMFSMDFLRANKLKFQEQRSTNDLYFVYAALVKAKRISVIYEVLAYHRINVKNSISMTREESWDCAHAALAKLREQLVQWGMFGKKMQQDFANYALHHSLWHLETLKKPAQQKFYDAFRKEWTTEYGLIDKKDYYYDKNEFEKLEYIKSNSYVDYLYDLMTKYKAERAFEWNRAEGLAKEAMKVGGLEEDVKKLKQQNEDLNTALEEIRESKSYKIGLAVTNVPRKIRSAISRD